MRCEALLTFSNISISELLTTLHMGVNLLIDRFHMWFSTRLRHYVLIPTFNLYHVPAPCTAMRLPW